MLCIKSPFTSWIVGVVHKILFYLFTHMLKDRFCFNTGRYLVTMKENTCVYN